MYIDYTQSTKFWENPELYRLIYVINKVPIEKSENLLIGWGLHRIIEGKFKGESNIDIAIAMSKEGLTADQQAIAWSLYSAHEQYCEAFPQEILFAEKEFELKIPGTSHYLVGKIDAGAHLEGERYNSREYKTIGDRGGIEREIKEEYQYNKQVDTTVLGMRALGYANCNTARIIHYVKSNPPRYLPAYPFDVERDEHDLKLTLNGLGITCNIIEGLMKDPGPDRPWPHIVHGKWAGYGCRSGRCEYKGICGQNTKYCDFEGFEDREEHLDIMKKYKGVA